MSILDTLVHELGACRLVDLSSDVGNSAAGPFQTTLEVIEAGPGAQRAEISPETCLLCTRHLLI